MLTARPRPHNGRMLGAPKTTELRLFVLEILGTIIVLALGMSGAPLIGMYALE